MKYNFRILRSGFEVRDSETFWTIYKERIDFCIGKKFPEFLLVSHFDLIRSEVRPKEFISNFFERKSYSIFDVIQKSFS
jgi:hypothetical protein